jgi:hypothetical protein
VQENLDPNYGKVVLMAGSSAIGRQISLPKKNGAPFSAPLSIRKRL